jgi:hypothetical protein
MTNVPQYAIDIADKWTSAEAIAELAEQMRINISIEKIYLIAAKLLLHESQAEKENSELIKKVKLKTTDHFNELKPMIAAHIEDGLAVARFVGQKEAGTIRAIQNTDKQHAPNRAAKKFVQETWSKDHAEYKSKADFSRIYSKLIEKQFKVRITPAWIADDWLTNTPSAS